MTTKEKISKRLLKRRTFNVNGCWFFTGPFGGLKREIFIDGRNQVVARVSAWLFLDFDLSDPSLICHKCKSGGLCWNPDHIYIGNTATNTQDSIRDGTFKNQHTDLTHCKHGHELSGSNLYTYTDKAGKHHRWCRTCRNRVSNASI